MTTPYIPILDSEVNPDAPITSSLMYRLRDNLVAVTQGDAAAPSISPAIIAQGGAGTDGHFNNAATLTGIGWYDFDLMTLTANKTIPVATVIRIAGNATLSAVLSVAQRIVHAGAGGALSADQIAENHQLDAFGAILGPNGTTVAGNSGGGGNAGVGGGSTGFIDLTGMFRPWLSKHPPVGGNGGGNGSGAGSDPFAGSGGGVTVIIVEGNLNCTGGTINADGGPSNNTGAGSADPGGGGGGTIIVVCMGTLTNGTYNARGGTGQNIPGSGGGGGRVYLVATAFVGAQTINVNKGGGSTGTDGVSSSTTLTRDQIRTLIQRWI